MYEFLFSQFLMAIGDEATNWDNISEKCWQHKESGKVFEIRYG
jgi:hypothetical protein